ncbi:MAG: hypothetical protein ACR2KB_11555 [Chitinophagaceae bacterium]
MGIVSPKSKRGNFFNEFVLMSVATIGAFVIGEYEEGVAVMVFYQIGEWFQDAAVNNAKRNIKVLLGIRPDEVSVKHEDKEEYKEAGITFERIPVAKGTTDVGYTEITC